MSIKGHQKGLMPCRQPVYSWLLLLLIKISFSLSFSLSLYLSLSLSLPLWFHYRFNVLAMVCLQHWLLLPIKMSQLSVTHLGFRVQNWPARLTNVTIMNKRGKKLVCPNRGLAGCPPNLSLASQSTGKVEQLTPFPGIGLENIKVSIKGNVREI